MIGYDRGGTGEILQQLFPEGKVKEGNVDEVAQRTIDFLSNPPVVRENNTMTLANMQTATLATYDSLMSL